ncbi:BREX-1 system adenine-specific DNA-methyltransferase PglX [Thiothrix nivea]|uniref:site-specific DNA-methyltransferase (adenine-specific) n=1 Tax=Thiothrix nivea (strain ATCC 35100 / DSM 5205 / JP2) TaxID=870187 RepID=A0A656HJS8_THINJ|nr:BREX-1 system adenine-specific DNA-methyltransferase PglX [Thiothrix nivea]EIJ36727.1 hypothetical protein Thini_4240 [Thiothrix nivea DSM 5205]
MNTGKIKIYAPAARRAFIAAVTQRLNLFGISADKQGKLRVEPATVTGSVLQIGGQSFDAGLARPRERLVARAQAQGMTFLVEQVAYTWFNRLCAIRFMELQGYLEHGFRVLSHPEQAKGFQVLDHVPEVAAALGLDVEHLVGLKLAGNQDEALFRAMLLGQCHALHQAMPFLFEALDDDTELLLPDNLTRTDSLLRPLVDNIPEDDWQQVEIIGWLYQFYIAERKDEVIGKVVKSADIPAATQLFTPNWIVQYLVQNSIGRQWLQTYPASSLKARMPYYIEPAQQTAEVAAQLAALTPESLDPEQLKVLDPACGSGHILVEAYQVLKAIYEERGYRSREIPQLILEKNLFGLDIDDRAAQLAGFALMMLARADDRRIFTRQVRLNVLAMQASLLSSAASSPPSPALPPQGGQGAGADLPGLWRALNLRGDWQKGTSADLFGGGQMQLADAANDPVYQLLLTLVGLFREAKTFGSLIDVPARLLPELQALQTLLEELAERGDTMQQPAARTLLPLVRQAIILAQRYDAVVANPPYMGSKGMNADLKTFAGKHYPNSKADLFAMFMERAFELLKANGYNAQVNMQSWMFLSSYEKLRESLLDTRTFITMAHLGARAFGQISGEVVQTTAWVLATSHLANYQPVFFRLIEGNEEEKQHALLARENRHSHTKQTDFNKIPGSPIAYWIRDNVINVFQSTQLLGNESDVRQGLATADDDRFLRYWSEVGYKKIEFYSGQGSKWCPFTKGGAFRKWYGNNEYIVNWQDNGFELKAFERSVIRNEYTYFEEGLTWTLISSGSTAFRFVPKGSVYGHKGPCIQSKKNHQILLLLNSCVSKYILNIFSSGLGFEVGHLNKFPVILRDNQFYSDLIKVAKEDWDSFETSWDFAENPLLAAKRESVKLAFDAWQAANKAAVTEMQQLEEENNRLFIDAYGLQDELTPDVPLEQITLTVNPRYRYGGNASDAELAQRFQSDTCAELLSYAIGCMMGRYRTDRPGLVYAHAGNADFQKIYGEGGSFPPDDDGIIPITDQEWFADDATNRFREFVRVVWGETRVQENLDFVAMSLTQYALKPKRDESSLDTIRRYLATQFYKDHLRTYKKRPIYWLFSSGKQKAFECLVYLHRYHEGTLARMRTEYVTPLLGKYSHYAAQLEQQADSADSTAEKNRLKKELVELEKRRAELRAFDDQLKHYADRRIKLDLDDGVKVNYGKFGELLAEVKAVTGGKE